MNRNFLANLNIFFLLIYLLDRTDLVLFLKIKFEINFLKIKKLFFFQLSGQFLINTKKNNLTQ